MQIDLKVAQLLCSRLCHDLVSPAAAVNAGLELMHEEPGDTAAPMGLMESSAEQLANRLAFFRVAFGLAEGAGGPARVNELKTLCDNYLKGGKVACHWGESDTVAGDLQLSPEIAKSCLNMVFVASESLPRGGAVRVHLSRIPEGFGIAVIAKGQGGRLSPDVMNAMSVDTSLENLNAHNVHAYYAQSLAKSAKAVIEYKSDHEAGAVQLAVLFQPG